MNPDPRPTPAPSTARGRLTRRAALAAAATAGAAIAATAGPAGARVYRSLRDEAAAGPASGISRRAPNGAGYHALDLGDLRVAAVSDGSSALGPIHPAYGRREASAAEVLALARSAYAATNPVIRHHHALAIEHPGRNADGRGVTLIDAGAGAEGLGAQLGRLPRNLARMGISPADVDTVVLTHLHADHCGGLLEAGAPAFPNARVIVGRAERDFWAGNADLSETGLSDRRKAAHTGAARAVLERLADRIELVEDGDSPAAGLTVRAAPGHTPGHLAVEIASGDDAMLHLGDVATHADLSFLRPGWSQLADADPAAATATRRALLEEAADRRLLLSGAHLPFPAFGHAARTADAFRWHPIQVEL